MQCQGSGLAHSINRLLVLASDYDMNIIDALSWFSLCGAVRSKHRSDPGNFVDDI